MKRLLLPAAASLLLFCDVCAFAGTITNMSIINNSSPDEANAAGGRQTEFRTDSQVQAVADDSPNSSTFVSRFAWMQAIRAEEPQPDAILARTDLVAYDLRFRIEDPLNQGYRVAFASVMRGYLTAAWQGNDADVVSQVFAAGTPMFASLDDGDSQNPIANLFTSVETIVADEDTPFVNELVFDLGTFETGEYFGTRDFVLSFNNPVNNVLTALQGFTRGEADVRFGLDPLLAGFSNANYPGVDGENADAHGHFLRVVARFKDPVNEVPEPAGLSLCGALALLLLRRGAVQRTATRPPPTMRPSSFSELHS